MGKRVWEERISACEPENIQDGRRDRRPVLSILGHCAGPKAPAPHGGCILGRAVGDGNLLIAPSPRATVGRSRGKLEA